MATIGIYDSGIGGLTTVKKILDKFCGNEIFYFSDNLHHPFGNTPPSKLKEVVEGGIRFLRERSDIIVLACNTASSITDEKDVVKLLPPLCDFEDEAESTLVMATAGTLLALKPEKFKTADTPELATLVEETAAANGIDMTALGGYLSEKIAQFKGVKNVILGCSHYAYCEKEIGKILGSVNFADGNDKLCAELAKKITPLPRASKITFAFSAGDEKEKYSSLLRLLMNGNLLMNGK